MANQRELNSYHNHSFEEMVDLITEKDEKNRRTFGRNSRFEKRIG